MAMIRNTKQPANHNQLPKLLDTMPPHSVENEMCTLGSLLLDWNVFDDVIAAGLVTDDFYFPKHQAIFAAMRAIHENTHQYDDQQIISYLEDTGTIDQAGGQKYIIGLFEAVPTPDHAVYYAKIVKEKANARRLAGICSTTLHEIYREQHEESDAIIDRAEAAIMSLRDKKHANTETQLGPLLHGELERQERHEDLGFMPTGWRNLDHFIDGLVPGDLVYVGARPSMGKTAWVLELIRRQAMSGNGVGMFSLEMSKQALTQRMLATQSGVDLRIIRRAEAKEPDFKQFQNAFSRLHDLPIYIDDASGLSLGELRARARRMVARQGAKIIAIDYLQLMDWRGFESKRVGIGEISKGLKALAKETHTSVVCLSQLSRPQKGVVKKPTMDDLREAGELEQDADTVLLLHRADYYGDKSDPSFIPTNTMEVIVDKNRNSIKGVAKLHFDGATQHITDLAYPEGGQTT